MMRGGRRRRGIRAVCQQDVPHRSESLRGAQARSQGSLSSRAPAHIFNDRRRRPAPHSQGRHAHFACEIRATAAAIEAA